MNSKPFSKIIQSLRDARRPLSAYSRQSARQLMLQYAISLILYPLACIALFLLAYNGYRVYRKISNDTSSAIFFLARTFSDTLLLWAILAGAAGWLVLTKFFISKPFRYLDEMIAAAEALTVPSDAPVVLSPSLKNVQDNLNLLREQALKNALLAKEAEQRKNDLVVYLAHDLKTPLTSVIGYLTLLQDEPQISQELRARYTGIALDKAQRLEELVNEFFDITRFNLTSLTLQTEEISLSCLLEQLVSEFIPVLSEKELTWRTEIPPDIRLACDPDKLERVFDNLIRNAVNYSYPGTEIFLSLENLSCHVEIRLLNHGKTIPPDKLARIFEQFFRLDASRSSTTGGSGLGLAIAREIVELHGGSITASSENESILFTVSLPTVQPVRKL